MKPTGQQIIEALPHVRYEIESLLLTPKHDPSYSALVESVEFRKMAHARVLYSFFTRPQSKRRENDPNDDDVLSEDYAFPAEPLYGLDPRVLLDRFKKDLFHLTYARLRRIPQTKRWPREELLPPVEKQSRKSIEHILQSATILVDDTERGSWQQLKDDDACERPLQQHTSNVAPPHTTTINLAPGS